MRTAIEVVWWIGLVGALVPTLVIVKQALLVIGTLRGILRLAEATELAARGIVVHTQPVTRLEGVGDVIGRVDDVLADLAGALRSLAARLGRDGRDAR